MSGASDTEPMNTENKAEMNKAITTDMNTQEVTPQPATRRRRKVFRVWEHFTIEPAGGGCTRACCKLCKQTFAYTIGSKVVGTSNLKRHIALGSCRKIKDQGRKLHALTSGTDGNTGPPKRRYGTSWGVHLDQELSYTNLAKLVILHDLPLHMVEHPAFINFARSLQPRFRNPSFHEIEQEVMSVYQKEKMNLLLVFGTLPGRISLTISLWTTSQTLGYVCLTGQFIDNDFKLHRRMLGFMMVSSPHSENALSEAIRASLSDWNMKDKLFTITLDNNCSSHDIYSANLRDHLTNKNTLMLKGQLFVVRCYAHILNEVARDILASIHGIIYSIREIIKFVKASPDREEKFAEIALRLEIASTKILSLDTALQWYTTYLMLAAALDYKQAFSSLETYDDNYYEAPSSEDWKKVEVVCTYLKLLYDSANAIMSAPDQTANIFFHEALKIQLELTNATKSENPVVRSIANDMHEKFDKYWKDCNLVLAISVVMDPRFKMKLVEFSFSNVYGDDAKRYVKVVSDAIHELYHEYVSQPLPLTPAYVEQGDTNNDTNSNTNPNRTAAPDIYVSEMALGQNTKPELEQYLEESLFPRTQTFDILGWWRLNSLKYPMLSKMARDVLSIPMCMVGPGSSIFGSGTGSRVLDEYRSSLSPKTVEALFCSKDWLLYMPTMTEPLSNAIVKMQQ